MIRLRAADPAHRIGSLFVNPGGPGTSGIGMVLEAAIGEFAGFSDDVYARFDLIGFDPRGIHASTPLRCFRSLSAALNILPPIPFPVTAREEAAFERADRRLNRACQRRGGPIVDHMATANVARDLDLLRAAVGDRQLTYAGYSYGSLLGITYANMFPHRVRAVVLDGVVDPIAWTTGRGDEADREPVYNRIGNPAGAQATLNEFFRLCDVAGTRRCAFAGGAARRFAELVEQLRDTPIEVADPTTGAPTRFTYAHLVKAAWDAMNDMTAWPHLAEFLADLETDIEQSTDLRGPASVSASRASRPDGANYPNIVEGNPGVVCSDSDNPDDHRSWSRAGADADDRFGYFGRMWTWFSSFCATWDGIDADRYVGPFERVTANPVLLVGTRFDPASPYDNAMTVNRMLPRSVLLTVDGWGHTSADVPSRCAVQAVSRYLIHQAPPPHRTTCAPDAGPFDTPGAP